MARRVEEALARRAGRLSSHGWYDPASRGDADIVVGQSGFCLEAFRASLARRPDARRVVYRESGPIDVVTDIADEERRRCGVPILGISAMSLWRLRTEHSLADMTVVLSAVSRDLFVAAGHPPGQVRIVRPGITGQSKRTSRGQGPVRFVFAASDPFRKGVRVLFDAWQKAALSNAQLVCVTTREISLSRSLVATLVSVPSIEFVPYLPQRAFLNLYDTTDCVVLPTFEDGFPFGVADGLARGIPAIVSDRSGIHEVLTHGEDAWIVPAGSSDGLAHALTEAAESRQRLKRMGEAAYETAGRFDWQRFGEDFCSLVFA